MKYILPFLFSFISITFLTGCTKDKEEVKPEVETLLQIQARMLKGKWKTKEGYTRTFDPSGNIIKSYPTQPGANDNTTYSYDGKIRTVDYASFYNRPPQNNPYTLSLRNDKVYLHLEKLLYLKDPEATYVMEITANEGILIEETEFTHKDGSKDFLYELYERIP